MEDVYTIKVKTKPDTRNLYPSERRYSASTVSGLAWVHIALAATSFLLACLALVNPITNAETSLNETEHNTDGSDFSNSSESTEISNENSGDADYAYILILAPMLLSVFALISGIASIMASVRWYIDRNITWLFIMSILSTIFASVAFVMVIVWFVTTSEDDISDFYKDKVPFEDFLVVKHSDVVNKNESHLIISLNNPTDDKEKSHIFTKRVLSINILIAAFLELLWSILSVKISYKGMRSNYKDNENQRRGNCIAVVTTIKGNNAKNLPRNGKLLPPKPDLIEHYPNKKIKHIFLAQGDNGFYLKNQNNKAKQNTETSSEFYKERMLSFLNRCASLEGMSYPEMRTPSVQSESHLNPIPEVASVEINLQNNPEPEVKDRMTPISWGDSPDHTIYNQDTLNLDRIFNFTAKNKKNGGEAKETNVQPSEEISENSVVNKA